VRIRPPEETGEAGRDRDPGRRVLAGPKPLRVLVVDDNRDVADSLSLLIKVWGHDVRRAYGGRAALDAAAAHQPDVLLVDLTMPVVDGNQVARQLRGQTRFKGTLLIAMTGYGDDEHCLASEAAGFDQYLVKPVDLSALEKLLLLEQGRRARPPDAAPPTPRPNGILVVDGDERLRHLLCAGMRQQGFVVWLAADGQEALDLYWRQHRAIDVVLLDVCLPVLDGPRTLAALRELNPRVCCCFMSGDLGGCTEAGLRALGAAVLPKPFHLLEVATMLWELASRAKWDPLPS
jgi:CheY-like chemotaxis protein